MKVAEIIFESTMPKKPKKRPKKTLWFQHSGLWRNDLNLSRPDHEFHTEENEETIYALDPKKASCYGFWNKKHNKGVTYHAPRPYHAVVSLRSKLNKLTPSV